MRSLAWGPPSSPSRCVLPTPNCPAQGWLTPWDPLLGMAYSVGPMSSSWLLAAQLRGDGT